VSPYWIEAYSAIRGGTRLLSRASPAIWSRAAAPSSARRRTLRTDLQRFRAAGDPGDHRTGIIPASSRTLRSARPRWPCWRKRLPRRSTSTPMLWRTSPAATELEEVTLSWLRQMLGLPDTFPRHRVRHGLDRRLHGARRRARHRWDSTNRTRGMADGTDLPPLPRVRHPPFTTRDIEKGAIATRDRRENVVKTSGMTSAISRWIPAALGRSGTIIQGSCRRRRAMCAVATRRHDVHDVERSGR